jgi:hypothetical protein
MEQAQNPRAIMGARRPSEQLDRAGWGFALIWIGIAIMLNLGWGIGLFGLGAIMLGGQILRRFLALPVNWFAAVLGICLGLVGLKPVLGVYLGGIDLLPILSIALGGVFVASALARRRSAPQ